MRLSHLRTAAGVLTSFAIISAHAQVSKYQPCPLLGPYLPPPTFDASDLALKSSLQDFKKVLDQYIAAKDGEFGPITPNTTSFSLALFAGDTYVPDATDPESFFFKYHHTADEHEGDEVDADSVFGIGDLTQVFTTLAVLASEDGSVLEKSILDFIPELGEMYGNDVDDVLTKVQWKDVTLGALAAHMAGIAPHSGACQIDQPCSRDEFVRHLMSQPPIELPDTTPIYSHAAFQLLAEALESSANTPFAEILGNLIIDPLNLSSTALLTPDTTLFGNGLPNASMTGEPASLGLISSIADLSTFGHALLKSSLLSPASTRRWLKPFSSTSNLRNSVGRPWEIYHFGETAIDPIIDVYTKTGSVGRYTSYLGLVPAVDVGFTILAVDSEKAADLNAYADLVLYALRGFNQLGAEQAEERVAGDYRAGNKSSEMTLELTGSDPGIAVTALTVNGTDFLSIIQHRLGIEKKEYLDMRLYPTNLESPASSGGKKQAFQAVIQDRSALADAGTPTCISWMTVGDLAIHADRFVLELGAQGKAETVEWAAGGTVFRRNV